MFKRNKLPKGGKQITKRTTKSCVKGRKIQDKTI